MVKTNQYITDEQDISNDDTLLAVSDEDTKIAWKRYHEKLLNTGSVSVFLSCHIRVVIESLMSLMSLSVRLRAK